MQRLIVGLFAAVLVGMVLGIPVAPSFYDYHARIQVENLRTLVNQFGWKPVATDAGWTLVFATELIALAILLVPLTLLAGLLRILAVVGALAFGGIMVIHLAQWGYSWLNLLLLFVTAIAWWGESDYRKNGAARWEAKVAKRQAAAWRREAALRATSYDGPRDLDPPKPSAHESVRWNAMNKLADWNGPERSSYRREVRRARELTWKPWGEQSPRPTQHQHPTLERPEPPEQVELEKRLYDYLQRKETLDP
jgi:hypothetical protein